MKVKYIISILIFAVLILSACGASGNNTQVEPTSGPDLALTITAQADLLQALTQSALAPTSTPQPTFTPAPVITETPSRVIVTVSADTNCRSGPGLDYDIVGALTIGQQADVVGKSSSTNYWIIKNPLGPGTCWLWGEHARVTGDPTFLQEVAVPPTVTPLAALSPVIDHVAVRYDDSSGSLIVFLDVYFYDGEGDANYLDLQLISTSVEVTGKIKDVSIAPSPNQRKGSVVTGQWSCGTKQYDVTVGVTIRDQASHTSNTLGVNFSCNKN